MRFIAILYFLSLSLTASEFNHDYKLNSHKYFISSTIGNNFTAVILQSMAAWTYFSQGSITFEEAKEDEIPTILFSVDLSTNKPIEFQALNFIAYHKAIKLNFTDIKYQHLLTFFQDKYDFQMADGGEYLYVYRYCMHEIGHALGFEHILDSSIPSIMNPVPAFDLMQKDIIDLKSYYPPINQISNISASAKLKNGEILLKIKMKKVKKFSVKIFAEHLGWGEYIKNIKNNQTFPVRNKEGNTNELPFIVLLYNNEDWLPNSELKIFSLNIIFIKNNKLNVLLSDFR